MACIYQYINKINKHMYIGLSINPEKRYKDHWKSANNPNDKDYNQAIHRALRKYGKEINWIFPSKYCAQSLKFTW